MKPETILAQKPKVLTQEQRQFYFDNGYLLLEGFVSQEWLDRLWAVTDRFINESKGLERSTSKLDLEPDHTAENPRLRRLIQPVAHDPVYWEFTRNGPIVDLAEDLLGHDIKFHHSKLNFKWSGGGEEVKWHQDIQFWPHTNYSVLTIGVYLEDVDDVMGPMGVVPGSHKGELFNQYNDKDQWVGSIDDKDIPRVDTDSAVYLKGPAGSVTIHHCRMVHGSMPNNHPTRARPLLLQAYSSADALPVTPHNNPSPQSGAIVRGKAARWAQFDETPCQIPPIWDGSYRSIFVVQQEEREAERAAAGAAE